jgi:hypothetical protein
MNNNFKGFKFNPDADPATALREIQKQSVEISRMFQRITDELNAPIPAIKEAQVPNELLDSLSLLRDEGNKQDGFILKRDNILSVGPAEGNLAPQNIDVPDNWIYETYAPLTIQENCTKKVGIGSTVVIKTNSVDRGNSNFTATNIAVKIGNAQTVAYDNFVQINFDTIIKDINSEYSTANKRFTSKNSQWIILSVSIGSTTSGQDNSFVLLVYKNNVALYRTMNTMPYGTNANEKVVVTFCKPIYLLANDYLEIYCYGHAGGGNYVIDNSTLVSYFDIISLRV